MFGNQCSARRALAAFLLLAVLLPWQGRCGEIIVKDGETIAFLGDSITAGGAAHGNYCRLVIHGLKTKGVNAEGIYAGVPGNKSSDMLLRLAGVLKREPDHLFLACGVNDIWHGATDVRIGVFKPPHEGMGVGLEHYKIYVSQILDRCEKAGVNVILSTITPIKEDPEFKLNKISEKYNAFLYEQAKQRGLPIARLNEEMFQRIAEINAAEGSEGKRNVLTSDGVHPTGPGHQAMAKGILRSMGFSDTELEALTEEWKSSPKILIVGDRRVNAGGRGGGWVNMVLDGMNCGRDMVTASRVSDRKTLPLGQLLSRLEEAIDKDRTKYMLLVPPLGDAHAKTSIDDYKKTLGALIELASKNNLKLVIATIPMLDGGVDAEANAALRPYNAVIREICAQKKVALADVAADMTEYCKANPGSKLTVGDDRLNHFGGKMLAECVLGQLGISGDSIASLREIWDQGGSYTFKYGSMVSFYVPLSEDGQKALKEISERFHRLNISKFLELGIFLVLEGDDSENQKRIASFDRKWLGKGNAAEREGGLIWPASANQDRAVAKYAAKHGIDREEFYERAFKVGMYVMRREDPLGRGSY